MISERQNNNDNAETIYEDEIDLKPFLKILKITQATQLRRQVLPVIMVPAEAKNRKRVLKFSKSIQPQKSLPPEAFFLRMHSIVYFNEYLMFVAHKQIKKNLTSHSFSL